MRYPYKCTLKKTPPAPLSETRNIPTFIEIISANLVGLDAGQVPTGNYRCYMDLEYNVKPGDRIIRTDSDNEEYYNVSEVMKYNAFTGRTGHQELILVKVGE